MSDTFVEGTEQELAMGSLRGILGRKTAEAVRNKASKEMLDGVDTPPDVPAVPDAPEMPGATDTVEAGGPTPEGTPPGSKPPKEKATPPPGGDVGGEKIDLEMPTRPTDQSAEELAAKIGERGKTGEPLWKPEELQGRAPPRRNINLDFFEDETTKEILELYSRDAKGYADIPQRKVQTHEETIAQSETLESLEKVLNGNQNDKWEPSDLVRAYTLMDDMAKEINNKAAVISDLEAQGLGVEDALKEFELLSVRFNALHEIASGRAAEAGRMLNSLQAVSKANLRKNADAMNSLIDRAGGGETIMAKVKAINATDGSLLEVAGQVRPTGWQTFKKGAAEWRYNAMLSSFRTHGANIAGSTLTGVYENVFVTPGAAAINNVEQLMRFSLPGIEQLPPDKRIPLREVLSMFPDGETMSDYIGALREAHLVYKGVKNVPGKLEMETGMLGLQEGKGKLRTALNAPTQMLKAEDAFFKTLYARQHLKRLARRHALQAGEDGVSQKQLYNEFMANPPGEAMDAAWARADKLTFTNDPSVYGEFFGMVANGIQTAKNRNFIVQQIVPFSQTPANILGYTSEVVPIMQVTGSVVRRGNKAIGTLTRRSEENPVVAQLIEDLGGATGDAEARADALSRITIATGLVAFVSSLWDEGRITGADAGNYGHTRARQAAGLPSGALRLTEEGDYYQLNRLDPMGLALEMIGTANEYAHNSEHEGAALDATVAVTLNIAAMLGDRSMLSGAGDLAQAFEMASPEMLGKIVARVGNSYTNPGIVRDFREMVDPYSREMATSKGMVHTIGARFFKSFQNAVPGLSDDLPPNIDAHGEYKINQNHFLWRGLVPIRTGRVKQDPVSSAYVVNHIPLNKPAADIKAPGFPVLNLLALDDGKGWVYHEYQKAVGKNRYKRVNQFLNSSAWSKFVEIGAIGRDSEGAQAIKDVLRNATNEAKLKFIDTLSGQASVQPNVDGESTGDKIMLTHAFTLEGYKDIAVALRAVRSGAATEAQKDLVDKAKEGDLYNVKPPGDVRGLPKELHF